MKKQEAADYLGVSTRTIERLAAVGRLRKAKARGRTKPFITYNLEDLETLRAELSETRPVEVFGRPNTPRPKDSVGFRLDPYYMKKLEDEGKTKGMSAGEYARRLVVQGLEMGEELASLRRSLGHIFYIILVTKMGASESEAEEIVRNIDGGS